MTILIALLKTKDLIIEDVLISTFNECFLIYKQVQGCLINSLFKEESTKEIIFIFNMFTKNEVKVLALSGDD